jgi:hypothetical protein
MTSPEELVPYLEKTVPEFLRDTYRVDPLPIAEDGEVLVYQLVADLHRWLLELSPVEDGELLSRAFLHIDPLLVDDDERTRRLMRVELVEDLWWPAEHKRLMAPRLRAAAL